MKSLLELLYEGELNPTERISVRRNAKYGDVSRAIADHMRALQERLSAAEFAQLEEMLVLRSKIGDMEMSASFIHGFKLGAGLMEEIIDGRNELLKGREKEGKHCSRPLRAD